MNYSDTENVNIDTLSLAFDVQVVIDCIQRDLWCIHIPSLHAMHLSATVIAAACMMQVICFVDEKWIRRNQTISSIKAWMQCSLVACKVKIHTIACCFCKITLVRYCPLVWTKQRSNTSLHQHITGQDQSVPKDAICDIPSIHVDDSVLMTSAELDWRYLHMPRMHLQH